jgi:hypothetical protein
MEPPMSFPDILANRHSVGNALWLYEYLLSNTQVVDLPWMPVAGGMWITDEQLAYRVDVTAPTIKRWRKKLEKLGYLHTEVVQPRFRRMWLANANASTRQQTLLEAPVSTSVVN